MTKIFAWQSGSDGCSWYRMQLPIDEYTRRGGYAQSYPVMPDWAREEADVIIGQRVADPGTTALWQQLCRQGRATMVYEVDDDLFSIDPSSTVAYRVFTPEFQDNIRRNAAAADVVTVSTEPLAEVFRAFNPAVVVVPNRIPAWLLTHDRPRTEHVTVGWAGSGTHAMDFRDAGPQIARFLARNPGVRYHVIGRMFEYGKTIDRKQGRCSPWFEVVDEYYAEVDFDVALAPLRPHTFNQSKSALKALEAAALGIPVVASAVGPYEGFVRHGQTGYLVSRDHEWGQYLRELTGDEALRDEMATAARRQAADHTVEGNLHSWLTAWGVSEPGQNRKAA